MNYFIRFDNNFYNVVDGNTNQVIASFVSDFEAGKFVQSLFGYANNMYTPVQPQFINPYSMNQNVFTYQNQLPMQLNQTNQNMMQGVQPQVQNQLIQPQMQNVQTQAMQPQMQNMQPANLASNLQQGQMQNQLIQPQVQNEQQEGNYLINNQNQNEIIEEKVIEEKNISSTNNIFEEKEIEDNFKFDFNDNTLSIDSSLFEEDKMGAIIQEKSSFVNNTDDDSLGEVAAYKDIKHLDNKNFVEEKANEVIGYDDLPDLNEDIDFQDSAFELPKEEKAITEIYQENLIPESKVTSKKDDDLIDLGPINEDDEIFSTPRKDAEQDDFETFTLSKKERAELKKAKKREELSRKRYQKLLR
ncbi:hypothetical protein [Spiroplasma sp. BIUS-1]|uniref:hypothetical protein n=1 Tax=Spiroplasma sp. BIUS-1 TaxID=216964 RepID=UPI00139852AE|nr:hypothetical protein [Spiroplasma sp. BIUS-1]QHX36280.1 hypothetical protein SBIUS_v1c00270 [Spiroplasma sp. BIUS-1]